MKLRRRIESLRDQVRELAPKQDNSIDPLRLSAELDRILSEVDRDYERVWRKYDRRTEYIREVKLELVRAVVSFGQAAIRSLLLVNGGAAISMMTFLGGSAVSEVSVASKLSFALLLFSLGVASAALVAGFSYLAQYFYVAAIERFSKMGPVFHLFAVFSAATSLILFVTGLLVAYSGFQLTIG